MKSGSFSLSRNNASIGSLSLLLFHANHISIVPSGLPGGERNVGVRISRDRLDMVCASSTKHLVKRSRDLMSAAREDCSPLNTHRLSRGPRISVSVMVKADCRPYVLILSSRSCLTESLMLF